MNAKSWADEVSADAWRHLYDLAARVRAMEPWHWMEETDIFGVRTDSGETLFVSVMGLLGEHHAVALYPGAEQLAHFWQMQQTPDDDDLAGSLLASRQVQACFGKKSDLMAEEKRLISTLGLAFKGAHGWPHFRTFEPGAFPWLVDATEVGWLTAALEQLLDVAPRIQKDRRMLGTGGVDRRYLIRVPKQLDSRIRWEDAAEAAPPPDTRVEFQLPNALFQAVRELPTRDRTVQLDVCSSYMRVGEPGARPQMPYLMFAVEAQSELVLGVELIDVRSTIASLWKQVPAKCLGLFQAAGFRPRRLAMRSSQLANLLETPCRELGISIMRDPELRALMRARRELESMGR